MKNFTLFYRTRSKTDPRVRWHKLDIIWAPSRRAAFERAGYEDEMAKQYEGRQFRSDCCLLIEDNTYPAIAMRDDEIDFDHYDFDGSYVEAARVDWTPDDPR